LPAKNKDFATNTQNQKKKVTQQASKQYKWKKRKRNSKNTIRGAKKNTCQNLPPKKSADMLATVRVPPLALSLSGT
jgi:hypothetical protein